MNLQLFFTRQGTWLLLALNAALALGGLALWMDTEGHWRHVRWLAPAPQTMALADVNLPRGSVGGDLDVGRFVAVLDRPLFSPSRRPPPPPPPPAPPPPVDPLANIQLFGVYGGKTSGGIVARIDGKVQRVQLQSNVGEWTVKSISGREVTFARGEESRTLTLIHAVAARAPSPVAAAAPLEAPNPGGMALGAQQKMQEEARAREAARLDILRRAGLTPLK